MASVGIRKSHSPCKQSCNKYRSCGASDISLDTSRLSIRMNDTNSYENTPSPSSIASTSTTVQSPKFRHRILSSTLKNEHSLMSMKRRSRYDKLFHYTQTFNRQYMITMTNILFRMQKTVYKLQRRTHRVEQLVIKQTKAVQPIIRIPRLTKDQLSTICINTNENVSQENEVIADDNNNNVTIAEDIQPKMTKTIKRLKHRNKKTSMAYSKKRRPAIWINNRQKPIDMDKYCSICRHEFAKRSNFLIHVRNIHKGKIPTTTKDQEDQSLLEMNEENIEENFDKHIDNHPHETTNDQSVVLLDDETEPLQALVNQWNISEGRLRPRTGAKPASELPSRAKAKCDICNKIYRMNYMKKHKKTAHPDQEISSNSSEINSNCDQIDLISVKTPDQCHLSNGNPTLIDELETQNANTPTTITIAEMDIDDEPIRFRADSNKTIIIAVTCLESYQIDLVEQFVRKFSSLVSQTTSIDSRTTHLITNDEQHSLRSPLSMKLIEAIAHHCICVSYRWVIDCLKYDRIIDEEPFEIEGDDTEVHPHGGPHRSRLIPNRHSLFQNVCFMIKCTENSDIRMTNERLEDLITTCGGQIITCVTQRLLDKYEIIVLCDMLYVSERRHNYDQCRALGIQFVSSDWVLESILEYNRKPFSLFEEAPL